MPRRRFQFSLSQVLLGVMYCGAAAAVLRYAWLIGSHVETMPLLFKAA